MRNLAKTYYDETLAKEESYGKKIITEYYTEAISIAEKIDQFLTGDNFITVFHSDHSWCSFEVVLTYNNIEYRVSTQSDKKLHIYSLNNSNVSYDAIRGSELPAYFNPSIDKLNQSRFNRCIQSTIARDKAKTERENTFMSDSYNRFMSDSEKLIKLAELIDCPYKEFSDDRKRSISLQPKNDNYMLSGMEITLSSDGTLSHTQNFYHIDDLLNLLNLAINKSKLN